MADKEEKKETEVKTPDIESIKAMGIKERMSLVRLEVSIEKKGNNSFKNYDYFRPDDVNNVLKPLLYKYRLFDYYNLDRLENGRSLARLDITTFDNDEKMTYTMDAPDISIQGANDVMNVGGTMTYTKRYLLMNAFDMADNEDDFDNNKTFNQMPKTAPKSNGTATSVEVSNLIFEARRLAVAKSKIDSQKTSDIVGKYIASKKIADIDSSDTLKNLINELNEVNG